MKVTGQCGALDLKQAKELCTQEVVKALDRPPQFPQGLNQRPGEERVSWQGKSVCSLSPWLKTLPGLPIPSTYTAPPLLREVVLFCRRKTRAPRSTAGCVCSRVAFRGWNRDTGPICERAQEEEEVRGAKPGEPARWCWQTRDM